MEVCYNCFGTKTGPGPCPHCGYDPAGAEEQFPMALRPDSILNGRYVVGRVLGQGGFGITYIAWDDRAQRRVAIKEYLPTEFAGRAAASAMVQPYSGARREDFEYGRERFLEEARTLAEFIGDEHIVRIYSYFEENGSAYFAMEFVEGLPLNKYMATKGGRLTVEEADELLLPLMDALELVHSKGIVHRDIAPDNIIITPEHTAKLLDFGAARYSTGEKSKSLDVVIKHGFAPKEQYQRRGRQGPFTDVYAMGATYYYAITGKVPPDAIDRIDEDELFPPSTLGIRINEDTESALYKAMEVSAADRFQSMGEFHTALTAAGEKARQERAALERERAQREQERKDAEEKARKEQERREREAAEKARREAEEKARREREAAEKARAEQERREKEAAEKARKEQERREKEAAKQAQKEQKLREKEAARQARAEQKRARKEAASQTQQSRTEVPEAAEPRAEKQKNSSRTLPLIAAAAALVIGTVIFFAGRGGKTAEPVAAVPENEVAVEATLTEPIEVPEEDVPFWTLSDGVLTISGQGPMEDYSTLQSPPWYAERENITAVVIQGNVKSIGDSAFADCSNLTSVTIPEGVTAIGSHAFQNCERLKAVHIPKGITSIDNYAFYGCAMLENVTIPAGAMTIGNYAFSKCSSLSSIQFPDSVTHIGAYAMQNCESLRSMVIPNGISILSECLFSNCSSLTNVIIPKRVTSIGRYAFSDCKNLKSITIPKSVTSISGFAFSGCSSLKTIYYEGSQAEWRQIRIGSDNNPLTKVNVAYNAPIPNITGSLFWTVNKGVLTISGSGPMEDYSVSQAKTAPWYEYRERITSVVIENGVTSIGSYAFYSYTKLTNAEIQGDITSIGNYAFALCSSLTSATIPKGVTSIENHVFDGCTSLKSVTIPESVTGFGDYSFTGCSRLTTITIPHNVDHIGTGAFWSCGLKTATYVGTREDWKKIRIGSNNYPLINAKITFQ